MSRFQCGALFARKTKPRGGRRMVRPAVEALEERALLSVAGTLDPTFGNGGLQTTNLNAPASANAVAIDQSGGPTNGDIYVAGQATDPSTGLLDFALARYLPDGRLDTSFGNGGEVLTNFGNTPIGLGNAAATALAVQSDGRIVVGGTAAVTNNMNPNVFNGDFAVVRYNPDGSPDTSFGANGQVVFDFTSLVGNRQSNDSLFALRIDSQNRIVVGGAAALGPSSPDAFALARLDRFGNLDSSFGPNGDGRVIDSINSAVGLGPGDDLIRGLAIDASDNIVVAGSASGTNTFGADFAVARYLPNGLRDGNFGSGGATVTSFNAFSSPSGAEATAVALGPGGMIVVAGSVAPGNEANDDFIGLAEYQSNGMLNPGFGSGGQTTTEIGTPCGAQAVAFDAAGNVVLAGFTSDPTLGRDVFAVARYTAAGALDSTFNPSGPMPGVVTTSFFQRGDGANGLAIQSDGDIVVAGFATQANNSSAFALVRYIGQPSTVPPPTSVHRPIVAEVVPVKVGKRRKLMVEVLDAATGALRAEFLSPFQQPPFRAIQALAVQGNEAGQPDEVLLTARRGRHTVRAVLVV